MVDGSREGFLVGWVDKARSPYDGQTVWQVHTRRATTVPGYWRGHAQVPYVGTQTFGNSIENALLKLLDIAPYGDVLAVREVQSGRPGIYTATVDELQADWLASLDEPKGLRHHGDGKIELTSVAVAFFRGAPEQAPFVDVNYRLYFDQWEEPYQLIRRR